MRCTAEIDETSIGLGDDMPAQHERDVSLFPDGLGERLHAARPRLLRLARKLGIPVDVAEDIVQDTLLAAWRGFASLHTLDRFDSWLNSICRNQCRMYLRSTHTSTSHGGRIVVRSLESDGRDDALDEAELPSSHVLDPLEELSQGELSVLVDRALDYLPSNARLALQRRYLEELPEREAAASLGVTVPVFEARLHRARAGLRNVLAGPLRKDALDFGLIADDDDLGTWRHTSIWCNVCGVRKLLGAFLPLESGKVRFWLRCPDCSERYGFDIYGSKGDVALDGVRSFRPALTRIMRVDAERTHQVLETGWDTCPHCGAPARCRVIRPDDEHSSLPEGCMHMHRRFWLVTECQRPGCATVYPRTLVEPLIWFHPKAQRFMAEHPHWITTPDEVVERHGVPTIRFRLLDVRSNAQLIMFADMHTMRILESHAEPPPLALA